MKTYFIKDLLESIDDVFALLGLYKWRPTVEFVESFYIVDGYALDSR